MTHSTNWKPHIYQMRNLFMLIMTFVLKTSIALFFNYIQNPGIFWKSPGKINKILFKHLGK